MSSTLTPADAAPPAPLDTTAQQPADIATEAQSAPEAAGNADANAAPIADPAPADETEAEAAPDAQADESTEQEAAAAPASAPAPAPMTPQECAQQLKARFPGLFGGAPKPLKLRVQADIQARAPGVFSKQALSAFLRRHTGSTSYLIALTRAKTRFDLDGQPADALSDEHRQAALDELARRRNLVEARRAEEDQQRRNRATLLRDFEKTTLTEANFCALKGVTAEELPGLLALARQEAAEAPAPQEREARGPHDRPHDRRDSRRGPPPARPQGQGPRPGGEGGRPAGGRPPRARGGERG